MALEDRDFDVPGTYSDRKSVCVKCHYAINDSESMSRNGEFYHPTHDKHNKPIKCKHTGKWFTTSSPEIEPFVRKRERRLAKRLGK